MNRDALSAFSGWIGFIGNTYEAFPDATDRAHNIENALDRLSPRGEPDHEFYVALYLVTAMQLTYAERIREEVDEKINKTYKFLFMYAFFGSVIASLIFG